MRYVVPAALVLVMTACDNPAGTPAAGADTPVVLELFTSEGCSSCPPADALLRKLVAEQPVPGARVIALSEHVEYWNSLGWRDRFSAPAFTRRQADYQAKLFPASPVYTPQAVIDGSVECIGSDTTAVRRALERAAQAVKADVRLRVDERSPREWTTSIEISVPPSMPRTEPAEVVVAAIENDLVTDVRRGENRGRTLAHDAVVRTLVLAGALDVNERTRSFSTTVSLDDDWKVNHLQIVAFLQERSRRAIIGAAVTGLNDRRGSNDGNQASRRRKS